LKEIEFNICWPEFSGEFHTYYYKYEEQAGVAQLVEHDPSKVRVAGSSLVSRSLLNSSSEFLSDPEFKSLIN
jgi:hypothetical protein